MITRVDGRQPSNLFPLFPSVSSLYRGRDEGMTLHSVARHLLDAMPEDEDDKERPFSTFLDDPPTPSTSEGDVFSVHEAIEAAGFGKFQIILSVITGFAWMADSMEIMLLTLITPSLVCEWKISALEQALCTTFVFVGWTISAPLWGWFCDRYGRKKGLFLASLMGALFGVATSFAPSYAWFVSLRALVGFAVGGVSQCTTYYTEFLPNKARAKCVIMLEVFWAVGSALESVLGLLVVDSIGWRYLVGFSAIPLLLFAALCWWTPESPRFHATRGNVNEATKILDRIARMNGKKLPNGTMIPDKVTEENRGSFRGLFSKQMRMTTVFVWTIWFMVTFAYYGLSLFTTKLFQEGDICHGGLNNGTVVVDPTACKPMTHADYIDLMATSFAELPGLLITVLIIEWMGRKKAMAAEFAIFGVAILSLYICMSRTVMVAIIFVARAFVSGGYQAAYVYTPEVYPTTLRASGMGTASAVGRIAAMLTPLMAQIVSNYVLMLPVAVYGISGLLGAVASLLLPIETAGRELKDVY